MKIDNIKAALSSRVSSLNIIPQNIAPKVTTPIAPNPQPTPVAQVSDTKVAPTVKPTPIKDSTTPSETVPAATTPARKSSKKTEDIEVIVSKFLRPGVDYDLIPNCGLKSSIFILPPKLSIVLLTWIKILSFMKLLPPSTTLTVIPSPSVSAVATL